MAFRYRGALLRRLAALTERTRRKVRERQYLREEARGVRTIRLAALRAGIDPRAIRGLAGCPYMPAELARRGLTPEMEAADAAFIAHDPELAARRSWEDKIAAKLADRLLRFGAAPPREHNASLDDWLAWALAQKRPQPLQAAATRKPAPGEPSPREPSLRQSSRGRGTKWKRRLRRGQLTGAMERLAQKEKRPLGVPLFARLARILR
jgi:hypothetical protein